MFPAAQEPTAYQIAVQKAKQIAHLEVETARHEKAQEDALEKAEKALEDIAMKPVDEAAEIVMILGAATRNMHRSDEDWEVWRKLIAAKSLAARAERAAKAIEISRKELVA